MSAQTMTARIMTERIMALWAIRTPTGMWQHHAPMPPSP